MHEEAILRDLVGKVTEVARENGFLKVTRVELWVGALSHFSEGSLRTRWDLAVVGTPAEGCRLELELSEDTNDPRAQGVVLIALDGEGGAAEGTKPGRDRSESTARPRP